MVKSRNPAGSFILGRDSSNSVDEDTKSHFWVANVNKHTIHTHMYIYPHQHAEIDAWKSFAFDTFSNNPIFWRDSSR